MFKGQAACIALGLAACSPEPAMSDEDMALLRESAPGISERCLEIARSDGVEVIPQDVRDCFAMEQPRRYSGYWLTDFETSIYCEERGSDGSCLLDGTLVWLSFDVDTTPRNVPDGVYRIEFTGRRTAAAGSFGHWGSSDYELVVEDLLTLENANSP